MTKKLPEDKNGLTEILNRIWMPITGFIGAVTLIYNFYKLWQGDQETVTLITASAGLIIWILLLSWISFSSTIRDDKKTKGKKDKRIPKYKYLHQPAKIALVITLILTGLGIYSLQQQRQNLANKLIIVIANFDGPEEKYGIRNQLIEKLNSSINNYDEVKIIPVTETITPSQGSIQARKLGQRYQADIVLWAWYRPTTNPNFTLHIENLSSSELSVLDETNLLTSEGTLSDLESFSLQQEISKGTSGLISFLAGYISYSAYAHEDAIIRFNQALDSSDLLEDFGINRLIIFLLRGTSYTYLGKFDEAVADFNLVIQADSQNTVARINRGYAYYELGKTEEAMTDFDQAIKINPNFAAAYINRGNVFSKNEDYDQAVIDFNHALQINPQFAIGYFNRGNTFRELKKYKEALADYEQVIKIDPGYAPAYYNRASLYIELKIYEKAIEDYNKVIEINPQYVEAYNNRGNAYAKLYKYDQAIASYNQAILINPLHTNALFNRGKVYNDLGQYQNALLDLDQVIQLDPQFADAYGLRGNIYSILGRNEEADVDFQKYMELTGNTP